MDNDNSITRVMRDAGLRGALQWLNERTRFRYTAVYVGSGSDEFKKVYLFDRENPRTREFNPEPVRSELCARVVAAAAPLEITDAQGSGDLAVAAFCGVPLHRRDDGIFGVICHFDPAPQQLTPAQLAEFVQSATVVGDTIDKLCGM